MPNEPTGDPIMGRRIRQLRGTRTQKWVVARMSEIDPDRPHDRSWLSIVELGFRAIHASDLELLARALQVSADSILGLERGTELERLAARYGGRITDKDAKIVETLLARLTNGAH